MTNTTVLKKLFILMITSAAALIIFSSDAAPAAAAPPELPRPHLGYGIHIAPNAGGGGQGIADQLGMDWVKLYDPPQIFSYPDKKILFRMDFGWPSNWEQFRIDTRARLGELARNGGVEAIEVHNEPNLRAEWPRGPNPAEYVQMLRVVYEEVKAFDPEILVISGGLAPAPDSDISMDDLRFTRQMFQLGAGGYFDAFGYHPYGANNPPEQAPAPDTMNFRRTELIRDMMIEFGLEEKPIWLTEYGWLRSPAEDGVVCSPADPSFRDFSWMQLDGTTQAEYTIRSYDFADRYWDYVGPTFLWNLNWSLLPDEALSQCSHMRWFSLLDMDARPTLLYNRLITMPRRPAELVPQMALVADQMTVEVGVTCPALVEVGQFEIQNVGYPGEFTTDIVPAASLSGPTVEVSTAQADLGDTVVVYADTNGMTPGLYIIYVNVQATIAGRRISQTIEGYVIVSESYAACD
jgi:hypothetical protein